MGAINELFQTFGPAYLERHASTVSFEQRKVVAAIIACRSPDNGAVLFQCEGCDTPHSLPRCCGNRHCPGCQHAKAQRWLERQLQRALPGHHFFLTFTVPEQLRAFLLAHPRVGYATLFAASAGAIKALTPNPRFLGADRPGFLGVLHTWGRQLQYHPHIHYLVPGAALSSRDDHWHPSSRGFFLPVHALGRVFRAKFRDAVTAAGLRAHIDAELWNIDWNVHCQPVPYAHGVAAYLAPYIFRVAIADSRIVRVAAGRVTFRYRKPHSERTRTLTLEAFEFIRRFLLHVLPTGFMKVRYFGFFSPSAGVSLDNVRARIELAGTFDIDATDIDTETRTADLRCPQCGGVLRFRGVVRPCTGVPRPAPLDHAPPRASPHMTPG